MKQPTPAKLAAAGFYYTGVDDEVMSPFMMKQIGGWEEDDEPMKEVSFMTIIISLFIEQKSNIF